MHQLPLNPTPTLQFDHCYHGLLNCGVGHVAVSTFQVQAIMSFSRSLWTITEVMLVLFRVFWIVLHDWMKCIIARNKKEFTGETVLVTGSGQNLGKELAIRFASKGAKVVLWDINERTVRQSAAEITASGGNAVAYVCDVSSADDVAAKAKLVQREVGEVSILVNNAGILQDLPFLELEPNKIKRCLEINLLAHFWTIRAFLPSMLEHNHGHIVAISSMAGLVGSRNFCDYSASKCGVLGLMDSLSDELCGIGKNIALTTVCPMVINTGMSDNPSARFPWITPILKLDDAADQIMDAIEKEEFQVTIPRKIMFFAALTRILPRKATQVLLDFFQYTRTPNNKAQTK